MIEKKDYLKPYKTMSQKERDEYNLLLIRWTEESMPRLFAIADAWTEADVKDFDEGCIIASAFSKSHGFISNAMRYEVSRRKKILGDFLCQVRNKTDLAKRTTRPPVGDKRYLAVVPSKKIDENGNEVPKKPFEMPAVDGRRPEHLSQYIHQLSPELQKESKNLENWYLQLASHKERALLLTNDSRATKEDIAHEAKETVRIESIILNFWERVDLEWQRATGKTIDESDMLALQGEAARLNRQVVKSAGEYTKEEIDAMDDEEMQDNCRRARIEANKKYVRRTDVQMSDERREQITLRIAELVAWGQSVPAAAKELCEKHGIVIEGYNDKPTAAAEEPAPVAEQSKAEEKAEEKPAEQPAEEAKPKKAPKQQTLDDDFNL